MGARIIKLNMCTCYVGSNYLCLHGFSLGSLAVKARTTDGVKKTDTVHFVETGK